MATPNLDALALIQDKIKHPTMGQNIPVGEENRYHSFVDFNTVKGAIQELKPSYSTDEIKTGGTFVNSDGIRKPIYQKTFFGVIPAFATNPVSFSDGLDDVESMISIEDYINIPSNQNTIPYSRSSNITYGDFGIAAGNPIKVRNVRNSLAFGGYEILATTLIQSVSAFNDVLSETGPETDLNLIITVKYTKNSDLPV